MGPLDWKMLTQYQFTWAEFSFTACWAFSWVFTWDRRGSKYTGRSLNTVPPIRQLKVNGGHVTKNVLSPMAVHWDR